MPDRIDTPLTNEHFAAFCLSMLGQPYWYGTALHKCSVSPAREQGAPVPVALPVPTARPAHRHGHL